MANDRMPRDEQTREKASRPMEWTPANKLEAPKAPDGFKNRWVRYTLRGEDQRGNVYERIRQHYEIVPAEEFVGKSSVDKVEDGKFTGTIRSGDLILTRAPIEITKQRDNYFAKMTDRTQEAIESELDSNSHKAMPFSKSRRTIVTRGRKPEVNKD